VRVRLALAKSGSRHRVLLMLSGAIAAQFSSGTFHIRRLRSVKKKKIDDCRCVVRETLSRGQDKLKSSRGAAQAKEQRWCRFLR